MTTEAASCNLTISPDGLARLMPLAVLVDGAGRIQWAGPTLAKVAQEALVGSPFLSRFRVIRPHGFSAASGLGSLAGGAVELRLRGQEGMKLRGYAAPVAGGSVLFNLSFGVGVAGAVARYGLTVADFSPADLTIEHLYLTEVKHLVTRELAASNGRLDAARAEAERTAVTDALTGLSNRRGFEVALHRAVAMARRGSAFALFHIDLDRFKAANDLHGHAAGDAVLRAVASVLSTATRETDTAARLGGDEFAIILWGEASYHDVLATGARLVAEIERPVPFQGARLEVSASIGVAVSREYLEPDAVRLLADADAALYAVKRAGRGRSAVWDPQQGQPVFGQSS